MFLKKSKVKGKTYYQAWDEKGFVCQIGTAEKILKMKRHYDENMKVTKNARERWNVVDAC